MGIKLDVGFVTKQVITNNGIALPRGGMETFLPVGDRMWKEAKIIYDTRVLGLCRQTYYNHPKGCPNFGERPDCPPLSFRIQDMLDMTKPTWVIYNRFDFGHHVKRMGDKHPGWTQRQKECCLYWQHTARKQLKMEIQKFLRCHIGFKIISNPEALGINLTATMQDIGIKLEWPPVNWTYQIVVAGFEK